MQDHKTLEDIFFKLIETVGVVIGTAITVLGPLVWLYLKQRAALAENTRRTDQAVDAATVGAQLTVDSLIAKHQQLGTDGPQLAKLEAADRALSAIRDESQRGVT